MKINKYGALGAYNKISSDGIKTARPVQVENKGTKNVDTVEISSTSSNINNLENEISLAKSQIAKNTRNNASANRLAELKEKISKGEYKIVSDKIVNAIFE